MMSDQCSKFLSFSSHQFGSMKGFIRLSHFKTLLYLGIFLGLVIVASPVTDKERNIVCPDEQQTTLMCSTNHTFLKWSISSFRQLEIRYIPYLDQNVFVRPIMVDFANFIFSRVSSPGALPLVSTMTIMNITSNLKGTMISCTGLNSSLVSSVVLMTTIHIYDMDVDTPNAPEITLRPDVIHLGTDNFTVILEWSQFTGETYTAAAIPEPVNMSFIVGTRVQVVMLYNIQYIVTVTATLCGDSNSINSSTLSYYYGLDPVTPTVDCRAPQFTHNSNIGVNFTETPSMEQNQNTAFVTAIVISTVIVYILSSVLIFIVGCACGWFGHKHKVKGLDKNTDPQATPGPVYQDLQPPMPMQGDPREKATFELKENVAYGPVPVRSA